jgi:hypothetical protein
MVIVTFQGERLELQKTDHALARMKSRNISQAQLLDIIALGTVKPKDGAPNKFWVFNRIRARTDNLISISVAIEKPKLVVITVMVNWSPK